jgi:small subunit ribosomal protein S19e
MGALDVPAGKLIDSTAAELEKTGKLKPPSWIGMVKSGSHVERVPQEKNFWFVRAASLLRTLYARGESVGVERLRHKYGGRKEHVVTRAHHEKAGGKTIRLCLQQLETAGFVKKRKEGGRLITSAGMAFLDKCAKQVGG